MIKELRKLRAKGGREKAIANYIASLQHRGKLTAILSPKGYIAYDTEEYAQLRKNARKGRPITIIKKENENE